MKKSFFAVLFLTIIAVGAGFTDLNNRIATVAADCFKPETIQMCPSGGQEFCVKIPLNVQSPNDKTRRFSPGYSSDLSPYAQPGFDEFSWNIFTALNWPTDAAGKPSADFTASPENKRVWEYYEDVDKVMGLEDALFAQNKDVTEDDDTKLFYMFSKDQEGELRGFKQADGYPLIDRNLNFILFEQKMNPVEADFIRTNNLTTKNGIFSYWQKNKEVDLPMSNVETGKEGAIEIKASWRILETEKGDDLTRYYTKQAKIVLGPKNTISGKSETIIATVGLVGMHIIAKAEGDKKWVWSTFEHVDNVPDNVQEAQQNQDTQKWSFYDAQCLNCAVNSPVVPAEKDDGHYKWNNKPPYAEKYGQSVAGEKGGKKFGSQIVRVYPIYYCTEAMNELFREKLKGMQSVFQNYRLIGTQWHRSDNPMKEEPNAPFYLANTTSESFMQEKSSCISCHNHAGIKYEDNGYDLKIKTDFSFALSDAK